MQQNYQLVKVFRRNGCGVLSYKCTSTHIKAFHKLRNYGRKGTGRVVRASHKEEAGSNSVFWIGHNTALRNTQQAWLSAQSKGNQCEPNPSPIACGWEDGFYRGRVHFLNGAAPGRSTMIQWRSLIHSSIWTGKIGVDRLLDIKNKEDWKLDGEQASGSGSERNLKENLEVNMTDNMLSEKCPAFRINLKITLYVYLYVYVFVYDVYLVYEIYEVYIYMLYMLYTLYMLCTLYTYIHIQYTWSMHICIYIWILN